MSVRYRVELVLDPVFTSRVYRARQLICGQYASWAAEMHMADVFMTDFFQCGGESLDGVIGQVAQAARQSHQAAPGFGLKRRGVDASPEEGHIHIGFAINESQDPVRAGTSTSARGLSSMGHPRRQNRRNAGRLHQPAGCSLR